MWMRPSRPQAAASSVLRPRSALLCSPLTAVMQACRASIGSLSRAGSAGCASPTLTSRCTSPCGRGLHCLELQARTTCSSPCTTCPPPSGRRVSLQCCCSTSRSLARWWRSTPLLFALGARPTATRAPGTASGRSSSSLSALTSASCLVQCGWAMRPCGCRCTQVHLPSGGVVASLALLPPQVLVQPLPQGLLLGGWSRAARGAGVALASPSLLHLVRPVLV